MNAGMQNKKDLSAAITAREVWVKDGEEGRFRLLSGLSLARASPER